MNKIRILPVFMMIMLMILGGCSEQTEPQSNDPADISERAMNNFVRKLEAGNYVVEPENYIQTIAYSPDQVYFCDPDDPNANYSFAFVSLNDETFQGRLDTQALSEVVFYEPGKAIDALGSTLPNSWIKISDGNMFELFYNDPEQPLQFMSRDENVKMTLLTLAGYGNYAFDYMDNVYMILDEEDPTSVRFTAEMAETGTMMHFDDLDLTLRFNEGKSDPRIEAWVKDPIYPPTRTSWTENDIYMLDAVFFRDYGQAAVPFPEFASYAMIFDPDAYQNESKVRIKDAHGNEDDLAAYIGRLQEMGYQAAVETRTDGTEATVYRLPLREAYNCYAQLYPYYDNGFVLEGSLYYDQPAYEGLEKISEAVADKGFARFTETDVFDGWEAVNYAFSRSEGWAYFFDYDLYMPFTLSYQDKDAALAYLQDYGRKLAENGFTAAYEPNEEGGSYESPNGFSTFRYYFNEDDTVALEFKKEKSLTPEEVKALMAEHGLPSAEIFGDISARDLTRYYYEIGDFHGLYLAVSQPFASNAEAESFLDEYTARLLDEDYLNMDPTKLGSMKPFLYFNEELKKYVAFDYLPGDESAAVNFDFVSIEPAEDEVLQSIIH